MRVLVVGGAGYIGSVTVQGLMQAGHKVTVLDNLSKGHRQAVSDGALFVKADMGDASALDAVFGANSFDAVMHFAALSLVGESVNDPASYFANNVVRGLCLLDAMLRHGVKQFVFSSTAAVYGEPPECPIVETSPLLPTNPYGHTKLAFERALGCYAAAYGLRYVALRYFNAAGASGRFGEDHNPETHLIPLILQVAQGKRGHINVFGNDYDTPDGTNVRDYIHVQDLASAHAAALGHLAAGGNSDVFNLGCGQGYSVMEIIEAVRRVTGHAIPVQITPRRAGDPAILIASSAKAQAVLGWSPQHSLEQTVADAWTWHQAHPSGYEA